MSIKVNMLFHSLFSLIRLKMKSISLIAFGLLVVCAYILTLRVQSHDVTRHDLERSGSHNVMATNQQECPGGFTPLPNSAYCSNLKGMLVAKSKQLGSLTVDAK